MSTTLDGDDAALLALRSAIDAVDRELLALLNRRAGLALEVGELKKREGSVVFRPEREAQVIDGLKAANAGPLQAPRASRRSGARSCRPAARWRRPPGWPTWGRPAPSAKKRRWAIFGSSIVRVPCANFDEVFTHRQRRRGRFRRGRGGELHQGGWHARSTCCCTRRCSSSARPACSCATTCCAATNDSLASRPCLRIRKRWRSAMNGSSHICPGERRPVASNAEGARQAALDTSIAAIASTRCRQ